MNTPEYRKAYMSNFKLDERNNAMLGIPERTPMVKPKTTAKPKVHKTPGKSIPCFSTAKSNKLKKENESKKNNPPKYFRFMLWVFK
jgi:hypothetical protein